MNVFVSHWEVLPKQQMKLWLLLKPIYRLGYILYGGTAIALRLGHRQSIDFDFFSSQPLDRKQLRESLPFLSTAEIIQDEPDTFTVLTAERVKVSFFGNLPFSRYGNLEMTDDGGLAVASLDDLMALKLKVILQRSEAKDYIDLAAMLESGIPLEKGLAIATQMFHPDLAPGIALKALTYFEGGDLAELSNQARQILVQAASQTIRLPEVAPISQRLEV